MNKFSFKIFAFKRIFKKIMLIYLKNYKNKLKKYLYFCIEKFNIEYSFKNNC
jgi:hypothetical protein